MGPLKVSKAIKSDCWNSSKEKNTAKKKTNLKTDLVILLPWEKSILIPWTGINVSTVSTYHRINICYPLL